MLTKLIHRIALAVGASLLTLSAVAQDSGPLIDLLVKKGLIDDQEAEELRAELVKDFVANSSAGKLDLGSRLQRFTLSGDGRVRYQYDNEVTNATTSGPNNDRSRYRYRLRLAATALLANNWTLGTRLETANGATSTNDDFGASGSTNFDKTGNTANIGQLFIQYASTAAFGGSVDRFDVRIGKHAHPFFTPGVNGFWIDSDINPEGFSEELVWNDRLAKGWAVALRGGQYILANNARTAVSSTLFTNTPAVMWAGQVEFSKTYLFENNPYGLRIAPGFVMFTSPNIVSDANSYDNLLNLIVPIEYTIKAMSRPLAFYATYGINFEGGQRANRTYPVNAANGNPSAYNQMFNLGARFGGSRNPGDLQLTAEYRYIEPGAYTGLLLDSDFNAGRTNGAGFIVSGSYLLTDAVTGTVTFFHSENVDGNSPSNIGFHRADVLQVDLSARF